MIEYSHDLPRKALDPKLAEKRRGKITVSTISLTGCWGCTLSLLDMDERLLGLLDKINFVRSSLTDIKRIPQRSDVGFIEGGVGNDENIETLLHFRERCDVLISVGACANWGGVPALRNPVGLADCLKQAYLDAPTAPAGARPVVPLDPNIPRLTDQVYPCHEVVHMDYFIPGCPPSGDAVFAVLDDLVNGRPVNLPTRLTHFD